MLNIKIILIIIGLIIFILGTFNIRTEKKIYKTIYKILPRNIYDELFLSYPLQYNKETFDNMDPEYVFDDEDGGFGRIYKNMGNFGDKYDVLNDINTKNLINYMKYYDLDVSASMIKDHDKCNLYRNQTLEDYKQYIKDMKRITNKNFGENVTETIQNYKNILKKFNHISNHVPKECNTSTTSIPNITDTDTNKLSPYCGNMTYSNIAKEIRNMEDINSGQKGKVLNILQDYFRLR